MSKELRPAHKGIAEAIASHARNITSVEKSIQGGTARIPAYMMATARTMEVGQLCGLLHVLPKIQWTPTQIEEIITELREIKYPHALIIDTIEKLEEWHQKAPAPA